MSTPAFLLVHGWHGSPPGHWQHWLAARLTQRGHAVSFPAFPNPSHPDLITWLASLHDEMGRLRHHPSLTVVCHSLGVLLWLHHLQHHPHTCIDRLILVAPPGPEASTDQIRTFFPIPLDASLLHATTRQAELICTNADPYCPSGASRAFGLPLGLEAHLLPDDAAHINTASGYGPWPWLETHVAPPTQPS